VEARFMPRRAEALPITRILPARRSTMAGAAARTRRGSGSTSAAKTSRHSASVTSSAAVDGALMARLATRTSMCPAAWTMRSAASASTSSSALAITSAPCSAKTSHSTGPMKAMAWVMRTRLPASAFSMIRSPACLQRACMQAALVYL
jgi:hypothetical protein